MVDSQSFTFLPLLALNELTELQSNTQNYTQTYRQKALTQYNPMLKVIKQINLQHPSH